VGLDNSVIPEPPNDDTYDPSGANFWITFWVLLVT
jgi:hypothetical protein